MSWSQALKKLWIVPISLLIVIVGVFIYDVFNIGFSWSLVTIYIIYSALFFIVIYFIPVLYLKFQDKFGFTLLFIIFILLITGSSIGNAVSDTIRNFIGDRFDLSFFSSGITVAALLIALYEIQSKEKKRQSGFDRRIYGRFYPTRRMRR